ncbi:MAG: hypothetical protein JXA81_15765 [Sedimentisphaerales bacterium]|nr:hypothetical protein [Sedimentisphaerales bacterium]
MKVIEYVHEELKIVDAGGGTVIGNSIQWSLAIEDSRSVDIQYSLDVPTSYKETIHFLGYIFNNKEFEEVIGDRVLHEVRPPSPWDMAETIETIDIDVGDYARAENVNIGGEFAEDYSGSLEDVGRGLLSGLKPHQEGGWAEYEFSVNNPGEYHIVLDYGELWTMYHHATDVNIVIDERTTLHTQLYPTTHCYGSPYVKQAVYSPSMDKERKAKWIVGSASLSSGSHTLRLIFPAMELFTEQIDRFTDSRPVITKIIVTNYPGLVLPYTAEPHHLDSYEPPPARLVHDRNVVELSDGRIEMTFHGTFYSLSQGNETYYASGLVLPRPGEDKCKFEIMMIEPYVFHLPPEGEQNFTLVVRSVESVSPDYSELIVVWLRGVPSAPSRKPYLFTTAQQYEELPPFRQKEYDWRGGPMFSEVKRWTNDICCDITDDARLIIPDRSDLQFKAGRYGYNVGEYFGRQYQEGRLPAVEQLFENLGWDHQEHGGRSWGEIWSAILASTYWRGNTNQAKEYVDRLSENMVFYPVVHRWDWATPHYMPPVTGANPVSGMPALAAHIRTCQEGLIDTDHQFRILHNLVLPIFNSYWDELRLKVTLSQDADAGDTIIHIQRPFYGTTGSITDGFSQSHPAYVKIGADPYSLRGTETYETFQLMEPLRQSYPQGTTVTSWAYTEEKELECRDLMSMLAIAASSRDWAVIDQAMYMFSEILDKHKIFLEDGSFKNEPGSYGGSSYQYPEQILNSQRLLGNSVPVLKGTTWNKMHAYLISACRFVFSNGMIPHLNGGGCMNQLPRACSLEGLLEMLQILFPEDRDTVDRYSRVSVQESNRLPGDVIDNESFVSHGYGYAMLRSENGSWDRGMETLLSSKHLLSDPGDHVSADSMGIVIYGLGAILTPRYGYSWISNAPPFVNSVMVDGDIWNNVYYGSFWHFDGRNELPSAVAHTGDGADCSELPFQRSRWNIQFPEYLFDAYFIDANDGQIHQYDWCFINMGDLRIVEPTDLPWEVCTFLGDHWPTNRGAGSRTIASNGIGRIVADWIISNKPWDWETHVDETLLRNPPQHNGRLRLIMAEDGPSDLIKAEIGWYSHANGEQTLANSQDILAVRKNAVSYAFVDTFEPIADDEQAYVTNVTINESGNHLQQLVKVTTTEGEDWVYLSGQWGARPDGDWPVAGIVTDADILAWRVVDNTVTRFYLAGGSYAETPQGSWNFGSFGNHYVADNNGG